MAQVRTRKQKEAQTLKRVQQAYSLAEALGSSSGKAKAAVTKGTAGSDDIFGYSVDLIKGDLVKTLVIGLGIVGILVAIVLRGV